MNFCKDCKWFKKSIGELCLSPKARREMNPVTGELNPIAHMAVIMRTGGRIACRLGNTCGKEGRWFEPKD